MSPRFLLLGLALGSCFCAHPAETLRQPRPLPWRPFYQPPPMQMVAVRSDRPIVSFRLVFHAGSVDDPRGKEGLTALTARMMAEGGTEKLSSGELLQALFPMAAELSVHSDKEFTTFEGRVHKDFLPRFLEIFTDTLLAPRFDPREFERHRQDALNAIRSGLRGEDDELLGKIALDAVLYAGHPYGHFVDGTVEGLSSVSLDDAKAQARRVFTQDRLVIGLGGAVDERLQLALKERLSALPKVGAALPTLPPAPLRGHRAAIVRKPTRSTAISMGLAFSLRRGDPDFFPVAFGLSYLGEHRQLTGLLFGELREKRGLNYGDYAYPEHFIQEGSSTFAETNIGRSQQDFSIWLRPVEPPNAVFATKGALYFLNRLLREGFDKERFETVRGFLLGYTRLWEQTDERRLGYAVDELFYGTPDYLKALRQAVARLTPEEVQQAMRRQLNPAQLCFVFVAQDGQALAESLAAGRASLRVENDIDKAIAAEPLSFDGRDLAQWEAANFMQTAP